jgi:hypothetical protein
MMKPLLGCLRLDAVREVCPFLSWGDGGIKGHYDLPLSEGWGCTVVVLPGTHMESVHTVSIVLLTDVYIQ